MFWCCMTASLTILIQLKSEACSNDIPPHAPYNVQAVIHASQCVCHSKNIRVVFFSMTGTHARIVFGHKPRVSLKFCHWPWVPGDVFLENPGRKSNYGNLYKIHLC